jgi:RNA polymerase sigma-70 factor, ECF subfamily
MTNFSKLQEHVLILRCQIGDQDALAELIGRYHRPLRYFISHLSENADMTEDVFQETWVKVIGKISTLRNLETFPAWLYRIARNLVYQQFRRKRSFVELQDKAVILEETPESAFSPADAAHIHACLQELQPEHREVLMLRFLEQMSYQRIADVLECNLNTVKSRIYYAKVALKKKMEGIYGQGK